MSRRARQLVILTVVVMLIAACGGDDGSEDPALDTAGPTGQEDGTNDSSGAAGGSDEEGGEQDAGDANDAGGAPTINPGDMPPAGQVVFEVDGQVFTIDADEMDYFVCDPSDAFTSVRSESETQDLSVQFDSQLGRGNATVIPDGSEVRYDSGSGPETSGGVSVDPPYIVYEGRFDASDLDDLTDITDVGMGRVSVTCP